MICRARGWNARSAAGSGTAIAAGSIGAAGLTGAAGAGATAARRLLQQRLWLQRLLQLLELRLIEHPYRCDDYLQSGIDLMLQGDRLLPLDGRIGLLVVLDAPLVCLSEYSEYSLCV